MHKIMNLVFLLHVDVGQLNTIPKHRHRIEIINFSINFIGQSSHNYFSAVIGQIFVFDLFMFDNVLRL